MAQDLLGFLDALDLREVTLMGLSMGGIVSFVFAAAHPERVRRLVVMDIGPGSLERARRTSPARWPRRTPSAPRMKRSPRPAPATRDRPTTDFAIASPQPAPLPDGTLTFKYDKALRDPRNLFDLTVEQRWEAWRAVSCPVLLVRGDDSDVLAAETAQRMLAENPNASLASVPECGHSITLDNPDGMLEVVSPWLAAAEAGQARQPESDTA